ncbi:MAG: cytochrome C [Betaproteobacteria bacterium]|nr:cytochrome C [Rhodocyclales bacterium]
MRTNKLAAWVVAATICLAGTLISGSVAAAGSKEAAPVAAPKLDNATCQTCHDGKKAKLETIGADGAKLAMHAIADDKFAKSVHASLQCVSCHKDITDSVSPHKKDSTQKPNCIQCHTALWEIAKRDNLTQEKSRLGIVVQNIEAYKNSFHSRPNKEDKSHVNATCDNCHDVHTFNVPPRGTTKRADEWRRTVPNVCGDKCHSDELEEFNGSVHGKALNEKNNLKAAVCIDCHNSHAIGNTSASPVKLGITGQCGGCHEENLKSYRDTYHGQVNSLGYTTTAECFDCHGSHGILKADDPKSKVHPSNRLKTCQQCHNNKKPGMNDATRGFVSFSPHGNSHDFAKYPEIWVTTKFMVVLLIGVFLFFWSHSLLWWYREYSDAKQGVHRWHIRTDALPAEFATKYVRRFGPMWRIAHLFFAISVMTLVLTGMAPFYAETAWAKAFVGMVGSPKVAGLIHRFAAFTMLGIFFLHLIAVIVNISRNWKNFKFFGYDSFVPNLKDLEDVVGMFKWFVGKGPRPEIERWAYWEKFDYWAVFWGMAIIGGSGMTLAFPHVVASVLPGWVFNVAMVVHGEEAFLAAVFLFTVHFFNNHFRPDKLPPPDVVMFTGAQSLEEFKHEHTAQYQRLVAAGELEKYLVSAPSAPFTLGSRILGLILLTFGLTILVLVAIGFFSTHF